MDPHPKRIDLTGRPLQVFLYILGTVTFLLVTGFTGWVIYCVSQVWFGHGK